MESYDGVHDNRIRHLEMIQAVIGRLAGNSFLVKGWAVTVAGAFFAFALSSQKWELALASFLPTITFWGLDAYFLRCERLFRALYERVRRGEDISPFFMGATSPSFAECVRGNARRGPTSWWGAIASVTLSVFYGTLVMSSGAVALVVIGFD